MSRKLLLLLPYDGHQVDRAHYQKVRTEGKMVFHPFERHSEPFIDELAQRIVVAKGTTHSLFLTELLAEERGGLKSSTRPHSELRAASAFFTELEDLL